MTNNKSSKIDRLLKTLNRRKPIVDPSGKIESQLDSAQKQGTFDNLSGAGKPLRLDKNPFTKDSVVSNEILKNSGFSLPFVEEKRDIETAVTQAERKLRLIWLQYNGSEASKARWQEAKSTFEKTIMAINKRILTFNLKAPSVQLHISPIRIDERIRAVQSSVD